MHRSRLTLALALAFAAALGGCAHSAALHCAPGAQPMVQERLFFGTQRPGGVVSDAEWRAFLDEVAVAFPDGFTTWEAAGAWRGPDGRTTRESSHVVEIVHAADPAIDARIADTIASYNARFDQDAVMRATAPACVAFQTTR